ncbi:Borealin-lik [Pleurostoma richardsiae]|uniref:Borealin-lik n=1 Tax=Pleurostoma richardsiae TaxID=41990 RepID=A0AA38S7Q1_9PEZI|nr:Borealin-lik [Pleurostoma richardsiae]
MAPPRGRKRKSGESTISTADNDAVRGTTEHKTPAKDTIPSGESPHKKRKLGITLEQKQALIDNLQLEITQRARKLRAQYNLQAQGLRTRIEIRVNRIPMALRKAKMGDLLQKYSTAGGQQQRAAALTAPTFTAPLSSRPPPVPEKDAHLIRPASQRSAATSAASRPGTGRAAEHLRNETAGVNKENEVEPLDGAKKRLRAHHEGAPNPAQVLSPTSSNTRVPARDRAPPPASPAKSYIARPASPVKQPSTSNLVSTMMEKARSTRAAATTRKATVSSAASSAGGATTTAGTRGRRGAAAAAAPPTRTTATRTARRVSGVSESSDGSTSTVVRKPVGRPAAAAKASAPPAATTKRTVMGTIRRGVAGTAAKKAAATKAAAPASTATGRVLRKRN